MNLLAWMWVAPLAVILVVGAILTARYSPAADAPDRSWGLTPRLIPSFGRISGTILVYCAGAGAVIALIWPLAYWARNSDKLDHKVYNWILPRANAHWLHSAMRLLTEMSNNRQTQVVSAFFMLVLTIVWFFKRRGGFVVFAPAVLILAAYEIEHQLQHTLKVLAHRSGPVPAGLGAFPSGGCARLIACYGLIIYLVLRITNKTRSRLAVVLWTLLVAATYTEAYSRMYLGKHWLTDVIGGLAFGVVLLPVFIAATRMLDRADRETQEPAEVSTQARFAGTTATPYGDVSTQATPATQPVAQQAEDPHQG